MKEKVLAISYFLPPYLTPQAIQIGRLLLNSQHDVIAISSTDRNCILDCNLYADFSDRVFRHIKINNKYLLSGLLHKLGMKFFDFYSSYPDCYKWWIDAAYEIISREIDKETVTKMVTFGQPMSDHILGLKVKRKFNIPWIAHFSDPWVDNPFRHRGNDIDVYNVAMERNVIEAANKLIFTSAETAKLIMQKYPLAYSNKVHILKHSYDEMLYLENKKANNNIVVFRYIGNLYGKRSPEPLFKALNNILDERPDLLTNVRFEFIGEISPRMVLTSAYRSLPKGLVSLKPSVNYIESLQLMKTADVLLVVDAPSENSPFFPSKLADYIGTGIFMTGVTPKGTSREILNAFKCPSADPENVKEIVEMFTRILSTKCYDSFKIDIDMQKKYLVSKVAAEFDEIILDAESV